jgi:hypothetical protein
VSKETIFDRYAAEALKEAQYDELEDGSIVGRIPRLLGVIEVAPDRERCEVELRSQVVDWARQSVRQGDEVPVLGGIDLNSDEARAQVRH